MGLCLEAVRQEGYAFRFVPENLRTAEICFEAVKQEGYALRYVPEKFVTAELCLEAVKQNGMDDKLEYELDVALEEAVKVSNGMSDHEVMKGIKNGSLPQEVRDIFLDEFCVDTLRFVPEGLKTAELCLECGKDQRHGA